MDDNEISRDVGIHITFTYFHQILNCGHFSLYHAQHLRYLDVGLFVLRCVKFVACAAAEVPSGTGVLPGRAALPCGHGTGTSGTGACAAQQGVLRTARGTVTVRRNEPGRLVRVTAKGPGTTEAGETGAATEQVPERFGATPGIGGGGTHGISQEGHTGHTGHTQSRQECQSCTQDTDVSRVSRVSFPGSQEKTIPSPVWATC